MDPLAHVELSSAPDVQTSVFRAVPDEVHTPIPVQDLKHWVPTSRNRQMQPRRAVQIRRAAIFSAALGLTALASYEMYRVLSVRGMTALQIALLVVFTFNFVWIAFPFVSGFVGFLVACFSRTVSGVTIPPLQPTPMLQTCTALLMPIYNEDPRRIFAGIQAVYESLEAVGAIAHFEFFILSDTTDPNIWLDEEIEFCHLRRRTGSEERLFYRHRTKNTRRKAGNIEDFCQRWGARYDHMIILDADSLMTGETLLRLTATMEANPDAGLIQTLPLVVNRNTLFARAQQFAARVYGPVISAGLAYWHAGDSSYWGHNAIIRTQAFMDHAGMPELPGRPPFGGFILSHDFVEAALLRRAGWRIYLVPELTGSYEECPPSLLDFAVRDQRWCQGNLQHIRVLMAKGLHWTSRLHLGMGIMSYLASPIWFLFIMLGILLALQAHFIRPEYFTEKVSLFPTWPVFDSERAIRLFVLTMAVLMAPKILGYVLLCTDGPTVRLCGGRLRAGLSVMCETLLSALIAPVTMVMQSVVVVGILTGRAVTWRTQRRDDGSVPLRDAARRHLSHTIFGVVLAIVAYAVSPPFLAWLSPVILGLLLAIPVCVATSRQNWGRAARRLGLLVTPEETVPPLVLRRANALAQELNEKRQPVADALERLVTDPELSALHAAMLPPPQVRRKGEFDVDLLVGLAKLAEADHVQEASAMLTTQEKLAILGHWAGFRRLSQLQPS
jgi:membrane glycosyltransferase